MRSVNAGALPYGTYSTSDYSAVLGQEYDFPDADNISSVYTVNSNAMRRCILVKNGSGGTLSPGQALKFVATYFRQRVQKATTGGAIRCFVPYTINGSKTNTIPDAAYFWAVIEGPTYAVTDGAAITEGDLVEVGTTTGAIKTDATVPAANKNYRGGTAMLAAAAQGTGATVYCRINARGTA
jgi:hypothetical protein